MVARFLDSALYTTHLATHSYMGGSRKNFRGGEPNKVGIKVAQLNVLLALQLRTSLVISQLPV